VEHLPHIFDRFYQVDTARTARQNGNSGLGLTMVRQIIENHGGTIEVQSTEGVGSTVTIILPDQPSDEPV
jgi:signal transduction histidine kinase